MLTTAWTARPTAGGPGPPKTCSPSSRLSRDICDGCASSPIVNYIRYRMIVRPITIVAFAAGAAVALGASTLQRTVGIVAPVAIAQREAKSTGSAVNPAVVTMDDERINLAQIDQRS